MFLVRKLRLRKSKKSKKQTDAETRKQASKNIQKKSLKKRKYKKFYTTLDEKLGQGMFSIVKKCIRKSDKSIFAVKIVNVSELPEHELISLRKEVKILQTLKGKRNIISLIDYFESDKKIHIILELCDYNDLMHYIKNGKIINQEPLISHIIYKLAISIKYMHTKNIVHRDIKPQNILISFKENRLKLRLIDFNLGSINDSSNIMTTKCGTPYYVAPEILNSFNEEYNEKCDYWSLGVCLYMMLCGHYPFASPNTQVLYRQIMFDNVVYKKDEWKHVSREAKHLCKKLLTKNPDRRYGFDEIMRHPFISK